MLYILEEVAKHGISDTLWRAYEEMTKEVRLPGGFWRAQTLRTAPGTVKKCADGVSNLMSDRLDGVRRAPS